MPQISDDSLFAYTLSIRFTTCQWTQTITGRVKTLPDAETKFVGLNVIL